MRCAVVDLGSNTFHTLVAEVDRFGILHVMHDEKLAVRIGDDAFGAGRIPDPAFAHGLAAAANLVERALAHRPEQLRVLATGVFRDAANGPAFVEALAHRHAGDGATVALLDGRTEAELTWLGVSAELAGAHGRLAIVDVGGGSLECMAGTEVVEVAHSFPLGVLRLRGRTRGAIRKVVASAIGVAVAEMRARPLGVVAVSSGTARALLRVGRGLGLISPLQRHVGYSTFDELARVLAPLPPDRLAAIGVDPTRHDTIATGAMIVATALERLGRPLVYVARAALREGALIELARRYSSRGLESSSYQLS